MLVTEPQLAGDSWKAGTSPVFLLSQVNVPPLAVQRPTRGRLSLLPKPSPPSPHGILLSPESPTLIQTPKRSSVCSCGTFWSLLKGTLFASGSSETRGKDHRRSHQLLCCCLTALNTFFFIFGIFSVFRLPYFIILLP